MWKTLKRTVLVEMMVLTNYYNIITLVLLVSCSHVTSKTVKENWISDPYSICDRKIEFCVVSEGKSFNEAKINARNEMAKIFEVKVNSIQDYDRSIKTETNSVDKSSFQKNISEVAEERLFQLETKLTLEKGEEKFALMSLNRNNFSDILRSEIKNINVEMESSFGKCYKHHFEKLKNLHLSFEYFSKRLLVASDFLVRPAITSDDINQSMEKCRKLIKNVEFEFDKNVNTQIIKLISSEATSNFIKTNNNGIKVRVSLEEKDVAIRVDGFLRKEYVLTFERLDQGGAGVAKLTSQINYEESARRADQIVAGLNQEIKSKFSQVLEDLKI